MRQNDSIIFGGPCQDLKVILSGKTHVLHADDVEIRLTQQQTPYDVPVEVLIGEQPEHSSSSRLPAGEQASADFTQVALLAFNPFPNLFRLLLASS